jgi:hypothetical protein
LISGISMTPRGYLRDPFLSLGFRRHLGKKVTSV